MAVTGATDNRALVLYAVLAAVVSLGLLVFAWATSDMHVTDVVTGAVTGFWLREATYIGRAVTAPPTETGGAGPSIPGGPAP